MVIKDEVFNYTKAEWKTKNIKNDFALSHRGNLLWAWKDKAGPELGSNAVWMDSKGMEFLLVDLIENSGELDGCKQVTFAFRPPLLWQNKKT